MDEQLLRALFDKYINRQCSAEEVKQLVTLLQEAKAEDALSEPMEMLWEQIRTEKRTYAVDWTRIYKTVTGQAKVVKLSKLKRYWWAAAVVIICVLGIGGYFVFHQPKQPQPIGVSQPNDVQPPSGTKAVIVLATGEKVVLDSTANGTLIKQGGANLVKSSETEIVYQTGANNQQQVTEYNTLFNPRGSKVISVTLNDGTKVWLNSESSLKYPTVFTGSTREVEITGEAYFEVTHNEKMPFKVKKGDVEVTVLGTEFNVNTYPDEKNIKVTLVRGSVKVAANNNFVTIRPGEQAEVVAGSTPVTHESVNIEEVLAWKNGIFSYTNSDLETIMRQMARWYNVEVVYKDKINDRYTVNVPRTVPLSQLFKFIEMSGGVHFEIEGTKVTVRK